MTIKNIKLAFVLNIFIELYLVLFLCNLTKIYAQDGSVYSSSTASDSGLSSQNNQKLSDAQITPDQALNSHNSALSRNILARSLEAGPFVFVILIILILFSVFSWAISIYKVISLRNVYKLCNNFVDSFWDYKSLNDLHSKREKYKNSPVKLIFLSGYEELIKNSKPTNYNFQQSQMNIQASLDNINRTIKKTRLTSKKNLEDFLLFLAICASVAPFVGLLGTVWGIMNSFEQIAATGSSSLAVVAPGVSEALIATAFGLAAAIPAVVGYNLAQNRISRIVAAMDSFISDYLNIIERYLISQSEQDINSGSSND